MRLASPCITILHHVSPSVTHASPSFTKRHNPSPCVSILNHLSPSFTICHQSSPCVTICHQCSPCSTILHQPSPLVTMRHHPSPSVTTSCVYFGYVESQRIVKNGEVKLTYCHEMVSLTLPYFTILHHSSPCFDFHHHPLPFISTARLSITVP